MKYYLTVLALLFILSSSLFSDEEILSKELYLEYNSYPSRVFTGQKFDIKLKALILKDKNSYDEIITTFTDEENIQIITQDINWTQNKPSEYSTTITYKTFDEDFILPRVTLALMKDEEIVDFISIKSPLIEYEKIAVNQKLFSNVIGNDLEILTVKTKQYTNDVLHTTINLQAKNSNLEDFKLNEYVEDQGIKSITENYPVQNMYYYVLVPRYTREIQFNYYNTDTKSFVMIHIPIILDEELVSTQTELNPYNSSVLIYKQIASGFVLFLFMVLFLIKRKNVFLYFIAFFILIQAYLFIPNKKVILNKDIKVYILPTNNSTIFQILDSKKIVEIINKKNDFVKVLFKNESIGWVKENDI